LKIYVTKIAFKDILKIKPKEFVKNVNKTVNPVKIYNHAKFVNKILFYLKKIVIKFVLKNILKVIILVKNVKTNV